MAGWIKLHRRLLDWEWYEDANTKVVFLHLLLIANHGEGKYKGHTLKAGQMITSVSEISEATGLSVRQTRTALDHLKTTSEVTIKTTNKFSVITLEKWGFYQFNNELATNKTPSNMTNDRQAKEENATRLVKEEVKEEKEEKKERDKSMSAKPTATKKFIPPTVQEVAAYCRERGNSVDPERFTDFYTSKGWMVGKNKMKDWKSAVRTWEGNQKQGGTPNGSSKPHNEDSRKLEEPGSLSIVL